MGYYQCKYMNATERTCGLSVYTELKPSVISVCASVTLNALVSIALIRTISVTFCEKHWCEAHFEPTGTQFYFLSC